MSGLVESSRTPLPQDDSIASVEEVLAVSLPTKIKYSSEKPTKVSGLRGFAIRNGLYPDKQVRQNDSIMGEYTDLIDPRISTLERNENMMSSHQTRMYNSTV